MKVLALISQDKELKQLCDAIEARDKLIHERMDFLKRQAEKAIEAAVASKDFTIAKEIQDLIDFRFEQDRGEGVIQEDEQGNRALVFPDGTFEELPPEETEDDAPLGKRSRIQQ